MLEVPCNVFANLSIYIRMDEYSTSTVVKSDTMNVISPVTFQGLTNMNDYSQRLIRK